jgi:hypothetical protein
MAEEVKNTEAPAEQAEAEKVAQGAPASGPVPTPGVETKPAPDLNISDLNAVRSIIDIATTRGAFKANELEAVGKTYNKLTLFLDHVSKQQQEQQKSQG